MNSWREYLLSPDQRTIAELRPVLRDPDCRFEGPVYAMYRDLARNADDREWLSRSRIRFDITLIPPADLCGELVKTKGHYHPPAPSGTGYPEVYEVLEGRAHYLLQREDLQDIVLVLASSGDLVLVPPGYGHVTINPGPGDLLMANLVSSVFKSDYRFFEEHGGAAYYELSTGGLEQNRRYPGVPPVRKVDAAGWKSLPGLAGPLYDHVERRDPVLGFLNHPERYWPARNKENPLSIGF
jgi:glucose-6-phosphate isomerase